MNGELYFLSGTSNFELFKKIEHRLRKSEQLKDYHPANCLISRFSDGEPRIEINDNIRGKQVYILQSTCQPVGENFLELCLMIDACFRSSAESITAVIPYFGLARQDRKKKSREPISASWAAKILKTSGARRLISLDLHCGQIQGFFDGPVDNLYARPIFAERINRENLGDIVIVTPDAGGTDRARGLAVRLNNAPIAVIDKRRPRPNVAEVHHILGEVGDKHAILFDDMVDTAGTIINVAQALRAAGAKAVWALCTHAVLSGSALEDLRRSMIDKLIVTDTIPLNEAARACDKIEVVSVASLIAQAIICSHKGESISALFE
ncbi:phosphoribosylpyrophosphate synthetase [Candidatus Falkowbacteria bacterium CG10_big_fil_rev_8_21_14_0_10_44_15]|uniref:ribose-phosphate diphosphokinase n=1 Tax=Candidatus Falkowbacteria bacterium CG10_big_fil_rev_8_21_14_0_10_44_15 TaxID=1974569 RepID=A0A2H0UYR1_9BACT|nr:MAG: phosphoribosylpyrophosphate synthetase [Candidatus Falkowbacteria bacterium CG10_big_fil_rev_8_21_14_0_10_44_15]